MGVGREGDEAVEKGGGPPSSTKSALKPRFPKPKNDQASMVTLRGKADEAVERGLAILDRLRPRLQGTIRILQGEGARKHWDTEMVRTPKH